MFVCVLNAAPPMPCQRAAAWATTYDSLVACEEHLPPRGIPNVEFKCLSRHVETWQSPAGLPRGEPAPAAVAKSSEPANAKAMEDADSYDVKAMGIAFESVLTAADRAWSDNDPCTRLRDRRTDSGADIADCHWHELHTPICVSYAGAVMAYVSIKDRGVFDIPGQLEAERERLSHYEQRPSQPEYEHTEDYLRSKQVILNTVMGKNWPDKAKLVRRIYEDCVAGRSPYSASVTVK